MSYSQGSWEDCCEGLWWSLLLDLCVKFCERFHSTSLWWSLLLDLCVEYVMDEFGCGPLWQISYNKICVTTSTAISLWWCQGWFREIIYPTTRPTNSTKVLTAIHCCDVCWWIPNSNWNNRHHIWYILVEYSSGFGCLNSGSYIDSRYPSGNTCFWWALGKTSEMARFIPNNNWNNSYNNWYLGITLN